MCMGRKLLYSIVSFLAITSVSCLVSCRDYEPFTEHDLANFEYETEFVKVFGKPMANHDFGFTEQPIVTFGEKTRTVDTNSNMWYTTYHENLNIPGFPDELHGYFRGTNTMNGDGTYSKKITQADADAQSDQNWVQNNVGNPKGDVTEEERAYVWKWFSEHQNPTSTAIHWDSFFIQYVTTWNDHYPSESRNMDLLGYESISGNWEHINNFNNKTVAMQYVYNAGTENWTYWSSFSSSYQNDKYNIQHLVFDIPQTNCPEGCDNHHYDGWYVAFDYEGYVYEGDGSLRNGSVFADGYYNDWIVKVSPGNLVGTPTTVRVMCEDLGGTSDWDFNDVVFDVSFRKYDGKVYAGITLQAAGGTLPITVGTKDPNYEVHKLLGDGSLTPIIHPATYHYYEVEFTGMYSSDNTANAKNIPIYVNGSQTDVSDTDYYTIVNSNVAQKFACPDEVQWTEENEFILNKYPELKNWIQQGGRADWGLHNNNNQTNNNQINNNEQNNNQTSGTETGDNQTSDNQIGGTETSGNQTDAPQADEEKGMLATLTPNPLNDFAFDIDKSAFATAQTKVVFTFVKKNGNPLNGVITKISNYAELVRVEEYSNASQLTVVVTDTNIINEIKTNGMSYRNYAGADPDVYVKCE